MLILSLSATSFAVSKDIESRLKNFRDPFQKRIRASSKKISSEKKEKRSFSNRPDVSVLSIEDIRITGIYIGEKKRAIAVNIKESGKDSMPFVLEEGMKIGPDGIEIKSILPGGIVLAEKIINVYDQVEYLETIIPVAED